MFGMPMRIDLDGCGVTLRPPKKSEMANFADLFSSMVVQRYTMGSASVTEPDEIDWWDRVRKESDTMLWAIVPDGSEVAVGNTALHHIHPYWGSCTSGIVIADTSWWGKGLAYRAHLARTWYAANTLGRLTIQSMVRVPNEASLKALLKVGYRVSGKHDRNVFRDGQWLDTYVLSWVNPERVPLLYPTGIPEELNDSLARAAHALAVASECVKFL